MPRHAVAVSQARYRPARDSVPSIATHAIPECQECVAFACGADREAHLLLIDTALTGPPRSANAIAERCLSMSRIMNSLKKMRNRAIARRELRLLSSRQLHDINLERVMVIESPTFSQRIWNGH